jgi:selenide, water dikinase
VHYDDRVLVDFRTSDDAGVYRWGGGMALVQTVDFFTPIVDDPFTYGQIAAANALSDIYAMGARPLTALAIAGFPKQGLEPHTMRQVFLGGYEKLREAGVALLGGHTVQDNEIKFGYAVTGEVDPSRVLTNDDAKPGDVLFLTKPLGTGVVGTAIKNGRVPEACEKAAIRSMVQLNAAAAEALRALPIGAVHACTDVTGFGFIGHGTEMAEASSVTLRIEVGRVPVINGALDLARENRSGGMGSNRQYFGPGVRAAEGLDEARVLLLYDPQTSGGLLIAAAAAHADRVAAALDHAGVAAVRVGQAVSPTGTGVAIELH